jgi:hypothetical protein
VKDGRRPKTSDVFTSDDRVIDLMGNIKSQTNTGRAYACTVSDIIKVEHGSIQQQGTQSVDGSSFTVPTSNTKGNKMNETCDEHAVNMQDKKPMWLKICESVFTAQDVPESKALHNKDSSTMDPKGTGSDTNSTYTSEDESDDETCKEENPKTHEEKKASLKVAFTITNHKARRLFKGIKKVTLPTTQPMKSKAMAAAKVIQLINTNV